MTPEREALIRATWATVRGTLRFPLRAPAPAVFPDISDLGATVDAEALTVEVFTFTKEGRRIMCEGVTLGKL